MKTDYQDGLQIANYAARIVRAKQDSCILYRKAPEHMHREVQQLPA